MVLNQPNRKSTATKFITAENFIFVVEQATTVGAITIALRSTPEACITISVVENF